LKLILAIILLISSLPAACAWMWYGMMKLPGIPAEGVFVDIPHGASRRYAAYTLKKME